MTALILHADVRHAVQLRLQDRQVVGVLWDRWKSSARGSGILTPRLHLDCTVTNSTFLLAVSYASNNDHRTII